MFRTEGTARAEAWARPQFSRCEGLRAGREAGGGGGSGQRRSGRGARTRWPLACSPVPSWPLWTPFSGLWLPLGLSQQYEGRSGHGGETGCEVSFPSPCFSSDVLAAAESLSGHCWSWAVPLPWLHSPHLAVKLWLLPQMLLVSSRSRHCCKWSLCRAVFRQRPSVLVFAAGTLTNRSSPATLRDLCVKWRTRPVRLLSEV